MEEDLVATAATGYMESQGLSDDEIADVTNTSLIVGAMKTGLQ